MPETEVVCPHAPTCELYEKFALQGMLQIWKSRYCSKESRYPNCERYRLALDGKPVPSTLLPNGDHLRKL